MNMEIYFKKVYTAAFRLTGEESNAEEIALQAVTKTMVTNESAAKDNAIKDNGIKYNAVRNNAANDTVIIDSTTKDIAASDSLQFAMLELVKIFLNTPITNQNENINGIQGALLKLKPSSRALVVWKDILGYKVKDNIPIADYSYEELIKELCWGRKELKNYISNNSAVERQVS